MPVVPAPSNVQCLRSSPCRRRTKTWPRRVSTEPPQRWPPALGNSVTRQVGKSATRQLGNSATRGRLQGSLVSQRPTRLSLQPKVCPSFLRPRNGAFVRRRAGAGPRHDQGLCPSSRRNAGPQPWGKGASPVAHVHLPRNRGLTLRSSRPAPARHPGRQEPSNMLLLSARAPCLRGRFSSNVRPRIQSTAAARRYGYVVNARHCISVFARRPSPTVLREAARIPLRPSRLEQVRRKLRRLSSSSKRERGAGSPHEDEDKDNGKAVVARWRGNLQGKCSSAPFSTSRDSMQLLRSRPMSAP